MAIYFINENRIRVAADSPAAAVAKNLRDAGYKARASGRQHVIASRAAVEVTEGLALVYHRGSTPTQVTIGLNAAGRHKQRPNPRTAEMDMPAPRRLRNHTIKIVAMNLPADAKVMHGGHNIIHDPLPDGSPARRSGGRTMFGFDYAPRVSQGILVIAGRNRLTFNINPRSIAEDPVDGSSVFVIPWDFGMVRPNPSKARKPKRTTKKATRAPSKARRTTTARKRR